MRIGIIQVDGKFPNLALMQICSFHEQKGDAVSWYNGPLFDGDYDKVYASKIFSFSKMPMVGFGTNLEIGGTGINFFNVLPPEIADCQPSYSLYPKCNYHIGFSMKGCRFACKFCCVPKKEGRPRVNSNIDDLLLNPKGGDRLMLLDNDFFGGAEWRSNLERIIELNLKICFVQGLNIRIITPDQAKLLAKCRYTNSKFNQKYLTFAWDRFNDGALIEKGDSHLRSCRDSNTPHAIFRSHRLRYYARAGLSSSYVAKRARSDAFRYAV